MTFVATIKISMSIQRCLTLSFLIQLIAIVWCSVACTSIICSSPPRHVATVMFLVFVLTVLLLSPFSHFPSVALVGCCRLLLERKTLATAHNVFRPLRGRKWSSHSLFFLSRAISSMALPHLLSVIAVCAITTCAIIQGCFLAACCTTRHRIECN